MLIVALLLLAACGDAEWQPVRPLPTARPSRAREHAIADAVFQAHLARFDPREPGEQLLVINESRSLLEYELPVGLPGVRLVDHSSWLTDPERTRPRLRIEGLAFEGESSARIVLTQGASMDGAAYRYRLVERGGGWHVAELEARPLFADCGLGLAWKSVPRVNPAASPSGHRGPRGPLRASPGR